MQALNDLSGASRGRHLLAFSGIVAPANVQREG